MKVSTGIIGVLAAGMLLGSGSCILACGCERPPVGEVRATVRTEAGQGVPGAALELRGQGSAAWTHTLASGAGGVVVFESVPALDDYILTVQPPQGWSMAPGQPSTTSLFVGTDQTVEASFVLRGP